MPPEIFLRDDTFISASIMRDIARYAFDQWTCPVALLKSIISRPLKSISSRRLFVEKKIYVPANTLVCLIKVVSIGNRDRHQTSLLFTARASFFHNWNSIRPGNISFSQTCKNKPFLISIRIRTKQRRLLSYPWIEVLERSQDRDGSSLIPFSYRLLGFIPYQRRLSHLNS